MHWKDLFYYEPLVAKLGEIDLELEAIGRAFSSGECDPLGLLDEADDLIGRGFVECQLYMIERKGEVPSNTAYACGPRHKSRYVAEIVHAAGNYRKHRGEWSADLTRLKREQQRTLDVLRDAGVVEDEFLLVRLLERFPVQGRPRLVPLLPLLVKWSEEFDKLGQAPATTPSLI